MASQTKNPLVRFFRGLFGFPEGEPGSCTCSGDTASAERESRKEEKAANREGSGHKPAPEAASQSAGGCCGNWDPDPD